MSTRNGGEIVPAFVLFVEVMVINSVNALACWIGAVNQSLASKQGQERARFGHWGNPTGSVGRGERGKMDRAQLGIDGDCGFALLGEDLQSGEAEFVKVIDTGDPLSDELRAAKQAFRKLQQRLNRPDLSYWFGRS